MYTVITVAQQPKKYYVLREAVISPSTVFSMLVQLQMMMLPP
jgi:hypothetical protein